MQSVADRSISPARQLRQARHDAHVAGWALAFEHAVARDAHASRSTRIGAQSTDALDSRGARRDRADRSAPARRATPHDFLRLQDARARGGGRAFETVRPDAIVELPGSVLGEPQSGRPGQHAGDDGAVQAPSARDTPRVASERRGSPGIDVLVELDDRLPLDRAERSINPTSTCCQRSKKGRV